MTALPAVNTLRPTISTDNNLLALSNLADIAVAGLDSPHSRRVYSAHLRRFFAYAQGRRLERALVQGWLGYVRQGGSGVAGRNQGLSAVKMLVGEGWQVVEPRGGGSADQRGGIGKPRASAEEHRIGGAAGGLWAATHRSGDIALATVA